MSSFQAFLSGYIGWVGIAMVAHRRVAENRELSSILPELFIVPLAAHVAASLVGHMGAVASFVLAAYGNLLSVAAILAFALTLGVYATVFRIRGIYKTAEERYVASVGEGIAEGLRELHGLASDTSDASDASETSVPSDAVEAEIPENAPVRGQDDGASESNEDHHQDLHNLHDLAVETLETSEASETSVPSDAGGENDTGSESDEDLLNEAMIDDVAAAAATIPVTPPPRNANANDEVGPWELPHVESPILMRVDAPLSLSPPPVAMSDSPVHDIL